MNDLVLTLILLFALFITAKGELSTYLSFLLPQSGAGGGPAGVGSRTGSQGASGTEAQQKTGADAAKPNGPSLGDIISGQSNIPFGP